MRWRWERDQGDSRTKGFNVPLILAITVIAILSLNFLFGCATECTYKSNGYCYHVNW